MNTKRKSVGVEISQLQKMPTASVVVEAIVSSPTRIRIEAEGLCANCHVSDCPGGAAGWANCWHRAEAGGEK